MTEKQSRRTFVKGVAATGTAATGLAAFGGQATAQQNIDVDASQLAEGLIVVQNVQADIIDDITVQDINVIVQNIDVTVQNIEILQGGINVFVDIDESEVLSRNVVNVVVQILTDNGRLVGRDQIRN